MKDEVELGKNHRNIIFNDTCTIIMPILLLLSLSCTIIEYLFKGFLFSKSSLNKKLLNIYLMKVYRRDVAVIPFKF